MMFNNMPHLYNVRCLEKANRRTKKPHVSSCLCMRVTPSLPMALTRIAYIVVISKRHRRGRQIVLMTIFNVMMWLCVVDRLSASGHHTAHVNAHTHAHKHTQEIPLCVDNHAAHQLHRVFSCCLTRCMLVAGVRALPFNYIKVEGAGTHSRDPADVQTMPRKPISSATKTTKTHTRTRTQPHRAFFQCWWYRFVLFGGRDMRCVDGALTFKQRRTMELKQIRVCVSLSV